MSADKHDSGDIVQCAAFNLILMPIDQEVILRILSGVAEPLFPSDITHQLNRRRGQ